jgi:hypothetical protein
MDRAPHREDEGSAPAGLFICSSELCCPLSNEPCGQALILAGEFCKLPAVLFVTGVLCRPMQQLAKLSIALGACKIVFHVLSLAQREPYYWESSKSLVE